MRKGDGFEEVIEFSIDRKALGDWYQKQGSRACVILGLGLGLLIGVAGASSKVEKLSAPSPQEIVLGFCGTLALCAVIGGLIGVLAYWVFVHRSARRRADQLRLRVEGAFLRFNYISPRTGGAMDSKIHFRAIVDYAVSQSKREERFGHSTLCMSTTAGGPAGAGMIRVPGVVNALEVRDQLAEIDALRE